MGTALSPRTKQHLAALFPPESRQQAEMLLVEQCGTNLPFLESLDAVSLERYRFAALKLSNGQLDKLKQAVELAKTDWRDLLVEAEFANDLKAHEAWSPYSPKRIF